MESEWPSTHFGNICEHSAFGPRFSGDFYAIDGNVATLRTTDISEDGRIEYSTMPLAKLDLSNLQQHILKENDLVITRSGRVGTTAIFKKFWLPVLPGAFLIRFRLNREIADPLFYRYFLNSPEGQELVLSTATGSVQQNLNITSLHLLDVPIPPLPTQHTIARILGSLDDEIELNRQMNETLEAMARAIFQSWFVDFDPVRAKVEGGDTGLPPEVAALFPYEIVEVDGREVPKGWGIKLLSEIASTQYGYTESATDQIIGPHFLRVMDINKQNWIEWDSVPYCEISDDDFRRYQLNIGDIVVARMADPGKSAIIEEEVNAVFASYLVRLSVKSLACAYYVYSFLKSPLYDEYSRGTKSGSVQANMNAKVITNVEILLPPQEILLAFLKSILPLRKMIIANVTESRTLAQIRDALLPKLMSGEISVDELEMTG